MDDGVSKNPTMPTMRSVSEPQRTNSMTDNIKSMFSNLKKAASVGGNSKPYNADPLAMDDDPLPDCPRILEGRLNQHLGQLDRLRRAVKWRNKEIKEVYDEAAYERRVNPNGTTLVNQMMAEIEFLRANRNNYARFVEAQHYQIQRIADKRAEIDKKQGQECTVYEMYMSLKRRDEWAELFSF
ncbi:hypothetical protein EDD37DRAFT_59754 [Exophiala viscosa]|uniref:Uncharacterized protein n=1 Tax=Exophiala viscosa TaxID=2486360 RepID=A0AAN6E478_9EURO|nr:hypothetical protein EDD36DRAFT_147576 [Exophiala viscosa]KAI1629595.1 hypothetical protein EDD37DRAFT_59754 [Exophiala viscosa]